ncbi:phage terminase small subunit, partial [Bacillus sp. D-CC]
VLMYVMLWRIDAGDYAGALEIGRHALRHGWVMPLGNRNVQTVLAEEMADAGLLSLRTAPIALCRRARDWSGISRPSVS